MKILCLIDSLGSGGAQRQLVEIGIGLLEQGWKLDFLIYHNYNFFKSDLENHGINVFLCPSKNYFDRIFKITSKIKSINPDVIISFLDTPNLLASLASFPFKRWKLIVGERSADPKIIQSLQSRLLRFLHLKADYIITNSFANRSLLIKALPFINKSKIRVIYNMLDENYWSPRNTMVAENNSSLKKRIVVAASHDSNKNCLGLINALSMLNHKQLSKLEIYWYGDGKDSFSKTEAQSAIRKNKLHDYITLMPAIKDIKEEFLNADVIGLFSFVEGLPNSVCEGMMLGKAIVCSNISDLSSFIKNQRLLFDPTSVKEIADTLVYLISLSKNELIEIGRQNREVALENFSRRKIIKDFVKLIDSK